MIDLLKTEIKNQPIMRNRLSVLFVMMSLVFTNAQNIISGIVKNTEGKKIASASITVQEAGKNAIVAYAITNSSGAYTLNIKSSANELDLKIKAFNHRSITKKVTNKTQTLNFTISPRVTEIKEVIIKSKIITKKGDTISYNLNKFASKNDRTLADVLKKIPGVEVQDNGTILYQGEPLNKFYVEGKDLMEGGYGLLTKSLPKDAISKVQVLENHQPVKILKDKVPSENAAINIKLKKKIVMTGRGEVGVGADPLLWNVKLTPMFLSKKNQWLINYKANNVGEEVEKEDNILSFGGRYEGIRRQPNPSGWLSVQNASTPNIPVSRYLMNNVHYLSGNLLTSPFNNKDWELKANASYSNNAVERSSEVKSVFNTGQEQTSKIDNNFYNNTAKAELIFSNNAEKGFFKNITSFRGFWNDNRANAYFKNSKGTEKTGDQSVDSPTINFSNSLSTIIPIKEKLINLRSFIGYQKDKQNLKILPGTYTFDSFNYDETRQKFNLENLEFINAANIAFSYKKWTITPEFGLDMTYKDMTSDTFGIVGNTSTLISNDYKNDNSWDKITPRAELDVNYKADNFRMFLRMPTSFNNIKFNDHLRNRSKTLNKTTFEPSFFAIYEFASFFKLMGFGSINYSFGDISSIYQGNIVTSPSNIITRIGENNNIIMPETKSQSIGSRLEYRNPLNNLFFNIRYRFSTFDRNTITQFNPGQLPVKIVLKELDNNTQSQSESVEVGKYFPKFKTNASVSFSNSDSNSYSFYDDLRESKTNAQTFNFKFNNTYFSWLSVDYNFAHSWNNTETPSLNSESKSRNWEHDLSTFIYPMEKHTFGFTWNQRSSYFDGETLTNPFFDLSYQYTLPKKNIDFELKWVNVANTKVYENVTVDGNGNLSSTKIKIRPSQVMFTVKFNFK